MCMTMPTSELDKVAQMAIVSSLPYVAQQEHHSVCIALVMLWINLSEGDSLADACWLRMHLSTVAILILMNDL